MVKVKRITGRGTGIRESDEEELTWAGDQYRKVQSERLKKIEKNITMHLGRGTKTMTLKDLPEPKPRPSTEGMTRITNRGTGSRKSTNKGNPKED
jgi:hypothetical protein